MTKDCIPSMSSYVRATIPGIKNKDTNSTFFCSKIKVLLTLCHKIFIAIAYVVKLKTFVLLHYQVCNTKNTVGIRTIVLNLYRKLH